VNVWLMWGLGGLVNMGSVALGTMCVDGHIVAVD